ncbi:Fad/Fmn-containing isoamyl alcohol oxidase [Neofusicoccum parvum]|uniref:Fad/Fmn-containing isoamyl alcohol oxidase n=1 Tax=Neofusicoccum parvum TaxID=310453 RepID=A0ACB5SC98_9PEZI|nr:Fad/Fmn-containing isoamyl alcohol oxidase [Neofusicoccum parvum]
MAPFFANQSCDPFTAAEIPCTLGNYVRFAINVSNPEDVVAGIQFANEKNIRLVIRNTGHESSYLGKSTGAGSLALWTHHLDDIDIIDYSDPHYVGKAIKIGAGTMVIDAYDAANASGLILVGGVCPTVGLAGGYSQGGGHSPLSSKFGLGADQVLEWEVVDGTGQVHVANRQNNTDLYWALAGGGGGTYGVVLSMTSKLQEDVPTSGASISFASEGIDAEVFWDAVGAWTGVQDSLHEKGATTVVYLMNSSFAIAPVTAPDVSKDELATLLQPYLSRLDELGVQYNKSIEQFPGFLSQHKTMQREQQVGTGQSGGWLIPRSVAQTRNDDLTAAWRSIVDDGAAVLNLGMRPSREAAGDVENAVLPAWREVTVVSVLATPWNFTAPWSEMVADQDKINNVLVPKLKELAPESGAYLSEANFREPDWKRAFYGRNYQKLREVKAKYDPRSVFYATTAVGSDEWVIGDDGRLCKKA